MSTNEQNAIAATVPANPLVAATRAGKGDCRDAGRDPAALLVRRAFELAADAVEGAVACCGQRGGCGCARANTAPATCACGRGCGCGRESGGTGTGTCPSGPGPGGGTGGTGVVGGVPGRPTRDPGTSTGSANGHPVTPGDLNPLPPRVWPGVRKNLYLPYLFLRANPGDTGTRPVSGPFWESPDVYILAGVAPDAAPDLPPALGQVAQAGADNTVYAHVWNLGQALAREVVVEFYWCNPILGFNPLGLTKIGTTVTQLGDRGSGDSHKVVKCPNSWKASYLDGGHECLLVRAWDVAADPMTVPEWDARINRHLGQRNIHVVPPGGTLAPIKISVGQLFGMDAQVTVERHAPATMPWLQLHSGKRGVFPVQALATGPLTLAAPGQFGNGPTMPVAGDGAQVVFAAGDQAPAAGQAHVYRVTASQSGTVVGGYTVVHQG